MNALFMNFSRQPIPTAFRHPPTTTLEHSRGNRAPRFQINKKGAFRLSKSLVWMMVSRAGFEPA